MGPQFEKRLHRNERDSKIYFVIRLNCAMTKKYVLYLFKTSRFMPRNQQFIVKRQQKNVFCVTTLCGLQIWCPTKNTSPTDTGQQGWAINRILIVITILASHDHKNTVIEEKRLFFCLLVFYSEKHTCALPPPRLHCTPLSVNAVDESTRVLTAAFKNQRQ